MQFSGENLHFLSIFWNILITIILKSMSDNISIRTCSYCLFFFWSFGNSYFLVCMLIFKLTSGIFNKKKKVASDNSWLCCCYPSERIFFPPGSEAKEVVLKLSLVSEPLWGLMQYKFLSTTPPEVLIKQVWCRGLRICISN